MAGTLRKGRHQGSPAALPASAAPGKSRNEAVKNTAQTGRTPQTDGWPANLRYPITLLKDSVQSVPANVYAVGVVGVVAAAMISITLAAGNWLVALGGGVTVLAGMVVLRIFAKPTESSRRLHQRSTEAVVLTWLCLAAFMVVLSLLVGKLTFILFPDWHTTSKNPIGFQPSSVTVGNVNQTVTGNDNHTLGVDTSAKNPSPTKKR
jgi:hypothetical protein